MDKKTRPQKAAAPRAKKTAAPKAPAPLAPCSLADFPRDPQVWLKSSLRPDLRRKIERIVIVNDDDAERAQLLWYLEQDEEADGDRLMKWAFNLWELELHDGVERLRALGIVLKPVFTPSPTPPPASAELRAILKPQVTRLPWVECPDKLIAALFKQVRKDVGEPRPQAMPAYFPPADGGQQRPQAPGSAMKGITTPVLIGEMMAYFPDVFGTDTSNIFGTDTSKQTRKAFSKILNGARGRPAPRRHIRQGKKSYPVFAIGHYVRYVCKVLKSRLEVNFDQSELRDFIAYLEGKTPNGGETPE